MSNNMKHVRDFHIRYDADDPKMASLENLRQYMSIYSMKLLLQESLCIGAENLVKRLNQNEKQIFSNLSGNARPNGVKNESPLDISISRPIADQVVITSTRSLRNCEPSIPIFSTELAAKESVGTKDIKYSAATMSHLQSWESE